MKTTSTIILATAALTGLALVLWNRMVKRTSNMQLEEDHSMERSRHRTPVFSRTKQQLQQNA